MNANSRLAPTHWVITIIVMLAVLPGCPTTLPLGEVILAGPLTTVEERILTSEFRSLIDDDANLADIVAYARSAFNADRLRRAGRLEDQNGVEITWAQYSIVGSSDRVYVVRHCQNGDCVSAVQETVGGGREIVWRTPDGEIPVRSIEQPFLLKNYSEDTGISSLAAISDDLIALANARAILPDVAGFQSEAVPHATGAKRRVAWRANTKFRAYSTFGWIISSVPFAVGGMADIMIDAGYSDASAVYNTDTATLDNGLSSLGRDDIMVVYGHGANSVSRRRVMGMMVEGGSFWSKDAIYSETRFDEKLDANASGGPGIIILAGCASSGMLPALDDPNRIVIGFSRDHFNQNVANAVKLFLTRYTAGDTVREAMEVVNASPGMANSGAELEANASANLDKTIDDTPPEPTPDDDCNDPAKFELVQFRNINGDSLSDGVDPNICLSGDPDAPRISWDASITGHVQQLILSSSDDDWELVAPAGGFMNSPVTVGVVPPNVFEVVRDLHPLTLNGNRIELLLTTDRGVGFVELDFRARSAQPAGDRVFVHSFTNGDLSRGGPGADPADAEIKVVGVNGDLTTPTFSWPVGNGFETHGLKVTDVDPGSGSFNFVKYGLTLDDCASSDAIPTSVRYGDFSLPGSGPTGDSPATIHPLERGCNNAYQVQIFNRSIGRGECAGGNVPILIFSIIDDRVPAGCGG